MAKPFRVGVHIRRPDARSHALHFIGDQHLDEFLGKLGVVVEDQVLRLDRLFAPQDGQISGLLGHPSGIRLTQEWQATSGSVNTSTTPSVQYGYSFAPSGSTNHSRQTSITYPNGRVLTYNYATGLADNISRLSSITDGATTLESYDYLGLGTVVRRAHAQTGVDQTYIKLTGESDGAAGDKYIGLDAFGRVVDQRWTTSGGTTADRFGYAYDRDSNRLYKENLVSASNSELYSYDNLNQLSSFQRGTLNGTKTGLTGSATRSQSWDFDSLGNFDSQTTDGTTQTRTANKQNEITSISGATTPTYDANGNLTKDETGRTFTYDAWNRLATVKNAGGTLVATYKWDGLGRRVREIRGSTTTDLYYSAQWQVLEERVGGVAKFSYAWSPVYVDAMIARDRDTDANGTLDERLYALQDANFNVTALINTSATLVERYQFDPFGKFGVLDGSWASRGSSSYGWNYLHQGGRWDMDGGIYSFRNRELSPTLGRWLQMDPIDFVSGELNLYVCYGNSPVGRTDSSGEDWDAREVEKLLNRTEVGKLTLKRIMEHNIPILKCGKLGYQYTYDLQPAKNYFKPLYGLFDGSSLVYISSNMDAIDAAGTIVHEVRHYYGLMISKKDDRDGDERDARMEDAKFYDQLDMIGRLPDSYFEKDHYGAKRKKAVVRMGTCKDGRSLLKIDYDELYERWENGYKPPNPLPGAEPPVQQDPPGNESREFIARNTARIFFGK